MKIIAKNKNKAINQKISTYPCVDFLHNALRFILENKTDVAYTEICYAIMKSGADLIETEKEEFDKITFTARWTPAKYNVYFSI